MEMSKPRAEHAFLAKLVGDWVYTSSSMSSDYDASDPEKRWTESVRSLGGLWFIAEGEGPAEGGGRAGMVMTLGFDPGLGHYVGTWVGSMMDKFWVYKGWVEPDGKTLTLEAEGPSFDDPTKTAVYHDVIHFIDDDTRTFSGSVKQADGTFKTFMNSECKRA